MKKFEMMKVHNETNYDEMTDLQQMIFDSIMYSNECDVFPTIDEIIDDVKNCHNETITVDDVQQTIEYFKMNDYVKEV